MLRGVLGVGGGNEGSPVRVDKKREVGAKMYAWSSLHCAIEKSDVQEHYAPMGLRMRAAAYWRF